MTRASTAASHSARAARGASTALDATTAMDPSQAALASEIARLSGKINSHRRGRGAARARGARGRGARRYMPSRHRTLSFSRSGTEPTGEAPNAGGGAAVATAGDWVKRRSNGSIALVNASVYEACVTGVQSTELTR